MESLTTGSTSMCDSRAQSVAKPLTVSRLSRKDIFNSSRVILKENEKPDDNLLCGICQEIAFEAKECETCETLFCTTCVESWKSRRDICPNKCPEPWQLRNPHKLIRSAISQLKFQCPNANNGCEELVSIQSVDAHENSCPYQLVQCPHEGCSFQGLRNVMDRHLEECGFSSNMCSRCFHRFAKKDAEEHDCIKVLVGK